MKTVNSLSGGKNLTQAQQIAEIMTTPEIHQIVGKHLIMKGHALVAEKVKYLFQNWELDLISMTKSGFLNEYEIKVSRSDFLADKKKITKHMFYASGIETQSPNYFSYVCPADLIIPEELPAKAGLYYIDEEGELIEIVRPKRMHTYKHNKVRLMEKLLRLYAERHFLGCALLTYKNRIISNRNQQKR